jgi:hypothetical protein
MATTDQHVFFRTQGDCVIEDNVFGAFLSDIRETPETDWPQLISEMSRAVEALVLFERSFVFSYQIDEDNDIAYFGTDNPLPLCSIIEELSKEKVLNFVSLVPIDSSPQPSAMLAQVNELQIVPKDLVSKFNEFNFAYYLYQQEIARHHDLPFVSTDSEYARSFVTGSNILKYSLSQKLVQNMNLTISKDFDNLIRTNREFSFFVPPFLAVVLDKVIKGASFGTAILELRHQFRSLRTMFMDYDRELHAPDLTVKEQLKRSARIVKEIEKASSAFSIKVYTLGRHVRLSH